MPKLPYRIGLSPSLGLHRTQTLARRLESLLAPLVERKVTVLVAGSYEHLEAMLLGGSLDVAWTNPAGIAHAQAAGASAIFQGVRAGRSTFRSALVARRDAGLTLEGLERAKVAWTDPDSMGGYRVPIHHLRSLGFPPERAFALERFTFSYPAALGLVLEGRVEVAPCFVDAPSQEALQRVLRMLVGDACEELEAIAFTDEIPNDGLVIAPALGREGVESLRQDFTRILGGPQGGEILALFDLDSVIPADPAAYEPVLQLEEARRRERAGRRFAL